MAKIVIVGAFILWGVMCKKSSDSLSAYSLFNLNGMLHVQGPGGVWCDVDVVEFSYFGAPEPTPKEQLYAEIVDDLRGSDPCIGSGSQVHTNSVTYPFQKRILLLP